MNVLAARGAPTVYVMEIFLAASGHYSDGSTPQHLLWRSATMARQDVTFLPPRAWRASTFRSSRTSASPSQRTCSSDGSCTTPPIRRRLTRRIAVSVPARSDRSLAPVLAVRCSSVLDWNSDMTLLAFLSALFATALAAQNVIVDGNVMAPMRDGVKLATDVYRPAADAKKDKKFKLHFLTGFLIRRRSPLPGCPFLF